jgi:hypothetical protein
MRAIKLLADIRLGFSGSAFRFYSLVAAITAKRRGSRDLFAAFAADYFSV